MTDEIPQDSRLYLAPMVMYVRAALVEIGFLYRNARQWSAWEAQRGKTVAKNGAITGIGAGSGD